MIENEQTTSNSFKILKKNLNSCITTQYLNEKDSSITLFKQKFILLLENYTNKIKKLNVYNQFIKVLYYLIRIFLISNSSFSERNHLVPLKKQRYIIINQTV